jgi:hypothetical protein
VRLIVNEKSRRKGRAVRSNGFTARLLRGPSARPRTGSGDLVEVPDYVRLANIWAVVEVVPGADGTPPEHLLWKTYRASSSGVIALALNGVTAPAVNRVMDRIVPQFPLDIPGVVYIDAQNKPLLAWVLNNASLIFGQTDEFRRMAPRASAISMSHLPGGPYSGASGIASPDFAAVFASLRPYSAGALAAWMDSFRDRSNGGGSLIDPAEDSTTVGRETASLRSTGRGLGGVL